MDHPGKTVDEKHTVEAIDEMIAKLRLLPPKDPAKRKLDKQESVKRMARELIALQERGYSLEEIADSVRGVGLKITTPTLKTYLQRATKTDERQRGKTKRASASRREKTEATKAPTVVESPAARGPEVPPGKQAETATSRAKTAAPSGAANAKASPQGSAAPGTTDPSAGAPLRSGKDAFLIKDKDSY
jgi:hypothetical protein